MNTDNQGIKNFTKIFLYGVNCVYLIVSRNFMKTTPKNKELIYFLLLFFSVNFSAQQRISITPPNNWTEFQRDEVMNTIYNKYSYSDKIKKELEVIIPEIKEKSTLNGKLVKELIESKTS